jgi:hypothetical protein
MPWIFGRKNQQPSEDLEDQIRLVSLKRGKPTGPLSRTDEHRQYEGYVPIVIDSFEPRMPRNRSLIRLPEVEQ